MSTGIAQDLTRLTHTIYYKDAQGFYVTVAISDYGLENVIFQSQIIWDSLNTRGYELVSTRP